MMKKTLNKIKAIITALLITIGSFCFKVMAQLGGEMPDGPTAGVAPYDPYVIKAPHGISSPWGIIIKIAQRILVGVTFIVGIVNLVKTKKIVDKVQKKKKIKKTIIILAILVVIVIAAFLIPTLLVK